MIHIFIKLGEVKPLIEDVLKIGDFEKRSRHDWLIDFIDAPLSDRVECNKNNNTYTITNISRFIPSDINLSSDKTEVSFKEADDVDNLIEKMNRGEDANWVSALIVSACVEKYLDHIDFWLSNDIPDEDLGGILFDFEDGNINISVVYGEDRPDLPSMSIVLSDDTGNGPEYKVDKTVMIRPYADEQDDDIENLSEDDEDEEFDDDFDDEDIEDDEDYFDNIGRFYADTDTLNDILGNIESGNSDNPLTFAFEITNIPKTVLFTKATDETRKIVSQMNGLPGIEEADSFLMILDRTVLGTKESNIKGCYTIKDGVGTGGAYDQNTVSILEPTFHIALTLNRYLNNNPSLYKQYQELDVNKSGLMISVDEDKLETELLTGKDRPDLACSDTLNMQYMFSSTKPVVSARPYPDELGNLLWNINASWEQKLVAADEGDESVIEEVAYAYFNGSEDIFDEDDNPIEQDLGKAFYWYSKLAELGNTIGQHNLAICYGQGLGVERDFDKATYWSKMSCENGNEASSVLFDYYSKMAEELPKLDYDTDAQTDFANKLVGLANSLPQLDHKEDYKWAFELASKAAEKNNPDAIWNLALCYQNGRGVRKNIKRAIKLFEKGADLGHAPSQNSLGSLYTNGSHIEPDYDKAIDLFKKAASQGNALAMKNLGYCYQFGYGVDGDMQKAIEWYEKSLEIVNDPELKEKVEVFKAIEINRNRH